MVVRGRNSGEMLSAHINHHFVNLALHNTLHFRMPHHLAEHAAVTTPNNEHLLRQYKKEKKSWHYLLGLRVSVQRHVGNHLVVRKLVPLRELNGTIQHKEIAVCFSAILIIAHTRITLRRP